MPDKTIKAADDFCTLVGHPNLLEYLGLPPYSTADEAMEKLRSRRRYMQGMQSNPKYKDEALFLIKNYSTLLAALQDPQLHISVMEQLRRAENLPSLETTIRNILKGGSLNEEQEEFLHITAIEMGIQNDIFQDTLNRLTREAGILRPAGDIETASSGFWSNDPYLVLDISRSFTDDSLKEAYERRRKQARQLPRVTLSNRALNQLAAAVDALRAGRDHIHTKETLAPSERSFSSTANRDGDMPTAPPRRKVAESLLVEGDIMPSLVKTPSHLGHREDQRAGNIEILGEPTRHLYLRRRTVKEVVQIRSRNKLPLYGTISTNVGWLHASPARLNGAQSQADISVRINPNEMVNAREVGRVSFHPEAGSTVHVKFDVQLIRSWSLPLLVVAFIIALSVSVFSFRIFPNQSDPNRQAGGLVISVDPISNAIIVNGEKIGSGTSATFADPPIGSATISVTQSNFKPHQSTVYLEPGQIARELVVLELANKMDFRPDDSLVIGDLGPAPMRNVPTQLMDNCMHIGALTPPSTTKLTVYIGSDGKASGVEIDGPADNDPGVRRCLIRQAASIAFPPMKDGDYGRVGYTVQLDTDS